jgi:hypothetical protein
MLFPQSPCIELYNASSNDILQLWKIKGKIKKEFEPYSKSYYQILLNGGVSILSLPIQEKQSLQISNFFLLVQFVLINPKSFLIELNVRDDVNNKKILKITLDNNYPLNIWTNLLIDTSNIFQQTYQNSKLKYIDKILITGNIKLRKIYTLKTKEEGLPKSLDLGKSVFLKNFFLQDLNKGLEKIDIKFSEHTNKKIISNININPNTPLKPGKNSYFKTEVKTNNMNPYHEMIKNNLKLINKFPKMERLANEIKYGLKINQDGIVENKNINKIFRFNELDNINTNKKERERSLGKVSLQKDIINNVQRSKNKSLNYKIKNNQNQNNENTQKKYIEKNNIENKENNSKIVFQNDTLYNFGNIKNSKDVPKFLSYGVSSLLENKEKDENNKTKIKQEKEILLQRIDKGNINNPIVKESKESNSIEKDNISNNNKFGNFEILLDSAIINNTKLQAQLYDSIEEESCLINNINSTNEKSKEDGKIIVLDKGYNYENIQKNINNNNLENSDFPDISKLMGDVNKDKNRPYTPPISKLVPINQSEIIEQKDKSKNINNPNNVSFTKIIKDGNELLFDEIKGCYYNPKTNIYYDIKEMI